MTTTSSMSVKPRCEDLTMCNSETNAMEGIPFAMNPLSTPDAAALEHAAVRFASIL